MIMSKLTNIHSRHEYPTEIFFAALKRKCPIRKNTFLKNSFILLISRWNFQLKDMRIFYSQNIALKRWGIIILPNGMSLGLF